MFRILLFKVINKIITLLEIKHYQKKTGKYVKQLKDAFKNIDYIDTNNLNVTEIIWGEFMNSLKNNFISGDERKFLQWPEIKRSMFVSNSINMIHEFDYLKKSEDWREIKRYIKENPIGSPRIFPFMFSSSANLIHHAYHLELFKNQMCESVLYNINFIFEFGGGYGSMCRLIHNMNFTGKYVIFDLPHFSELQKYYLRNLNLPVIDSIEDFSNSKSGIYCFSDHKQFSKIINQESKKMFLATWSFSESPITVRENLSPFLMSFDKYLVAFQEQFGEVDNNLYFKNITDANSQYNWKYIKIKHLPENKYLFGSK